jgi:hypothetical protein
LKQQVYARFSACLFFFFGAVIFALFNNPLVSANYAIFGMAWLVRFLDVWLEPEKWKQKQ